MAAPPSMDQGLTPNQILRNQTWNTEIAKESFYDAAIVHHYVKYPGLQSIPNHNDKMIAAHHYLDKEVNDFLPQIFTELKNYFPLKEILITEYNAKTDYVGNSILHILFLAHYIMKIIQFNSENKNFINKMCIQNYLGGGKENPLITPKKNNDPNNIDQGSYFTKRAPYYLFELLKPIYSKKTKVIKDHKLFEIKNTNLLYTYSFVQLKDSKLLMVVINKSGHIREVSINKLSVNVNNFIYKIDTNTSSHLINSVSANQLDASVGITKYAPPELFKKIEFNKSSFIKKVSLPEYSISLITIQLHKL